MVEGIIKKYRYISYWDGRNYNTNYDWSQYSKSLKDYYGSALLNGNAVAFLAYEDEKAIAMVTMCFYNIIPLVSNVEGKMALIIDMYTECEYRNQGIGTKLLIEIMEYAIDTKKDLLESQKIY